MKLTKYGHACVLLQENDKKLLIDPGAFSFSAESPVESIGAVDGIIITHAHFDHFEINAIKHLLSLKEVTVVGNQAVAEALRSENIPVTSYADNTVNELAGFTIKALPALHGPMPQQPGLNTAYLINENILHPGDSYEISNAEVGVKTLLLPTQGPWSRFVDAIEFAKQINPKMVIPIHNGVLKDEIGKQFDTTISASLKELGITCELLDVGSSMEIALLKPGIYKHFKGHEYEVIGIAKDSETREPFVVYRELYSDFGLSIRPLPMFTEEIERENYKGPRFWWVRESNEQPLEL